MNLKDKLGIVGLGFVGTAIAESLSDHDLVKVDTDPKKNANGTLEELMTCDGIFVCVPSPSNNNGSCDTTILEKVLDSLKEYNGVIISKTTAPPDVYAKLGAMYKNLVHVPEFLTAANASRDYIYGEFAFIGGSVAAYQRDADRIVQISQPYLKRVKFCSIAEAALAKYTINSFLATKVVFMNEISAIASAAGINYDSILHLLEEDSRMGSTHMRVPGPDGTHGFGGACFPKDTNALLNYANSLGVGLSVLNSAVNKNTLLRLTTDK